jgi:hypothetical protein
MPLRIVATLAKLLERFDPEQFRLRESASQTKTLTVRLHPLTNQVHDQVIRYLCEELTSTETLFPGTDLRLIYQIAGSC